MGFLSEGAALPWEQAKKHAEYIRQQGLEQFLHVYRAALPREGDPLLWGDEIEYLIIALDADKQAARLSLRSPALLHELGADERTNPTPKTCWRPEYGSFMLESTPGMPYDGEKARDLLRVQANMELRRTLANQLLQPDERLLALTAYPMMGVGEFTSPPPPSDWQPGSDTYAASLFIQDQIINPHPRFGTLSANIRKRKTATVDINVPLFQDTATLPPQYGPEYNPTQTEAQTAPPGAAPGCIYMDAMAFGMGCCCLQSTFQCRDIQQARYFYDHLANLSPILMALSASAPIFRGYLADADVRWNVISAAVDDRTPVERGLDGATGEARFGRVHKSRYDSISLYLAEGVDPALNDVPAAINPAAYKTLREAGVDHLLAQHLAHLFIRDPLVIYDNRIDLDAATNMDHFENIQSTNWQTVRFKPPPVGSSIGWRVEFRSIEAQLTEFENAAFATFVILFTRAMLAFQLDLYTPLSNVDANMKRGHARNAVLQEKFFFRDSLAGSAGISEYSIAEIMNGHGDEPGLIAWVERYLDSLEETQMPGEVRAVLNKYLAFLGKRASGEYLTTAAWLRRFVVQHPDYRQDSVVSHKINYDLLVAVAEISEGRLEAPDLIPSLAHRQLPPGVSPA